MSGNCHMRLTFDVNMSAEWFNSVVHAVISKALCCAGFLTTIAFLHFFLVLNEMLNFMILHHYTMCCWHFSCLKWWPWWVAWTMCRNSETTFGVGVGVSVTVQLVASWIRWKLGHTSMFLNSLAHVNTQHLIYCLDSNLKCFFPNLLKSNTPSDYDEFFPVSENTSLLSRTPQKMSMVL